MSEIGKAYVQIVPTTKNIGQNLSSALGGASTKAGKEAGAKIGTGIVGKVKGVLVAAGIGKVIKDAFTAGADLQQSIGGVETLYGEAAGKMKQYAADAYKTAGVSANDYMQQSTSFAAALLSSLGGDSEAAAEAANQAIIDMADNSNKMGTSLESVQAAYQGFAKGQYQLLDNLKLGYGGTKTEMQRLLKDAQKITGEKYDIKNLDDVYAAIHAIQGELGITGTTAEEAANTMSGSIGMMKSAWQNILADLALGNEIDIGPMVESIKAVATNALPAISSIITELPGALIGIAAELAPSLIPVAMDFINSIITGFQENLPQLLTAAQAIIDGIISGIQSVDLAPFLTAAGQIIMMIAEAVMTNLPGLLDAGFQILTSLLNGIMEALPIIAEQLPILIESICGWITANLPQMIQTGVTFFMALIQALPEAISGICAVLPTIVTSIVNTLIDNLPLIISAGIQLFMALVEALPDIIVSIAGAAIEVVSSLIDTISSRWEEIKQCGKDLIQGLIDGIKEMVTGLISAATEVCGQLVSTIKEKLGIHSPSTVAREIGGYFGEGFALGMTDESKKIADAANSMAMDAVGALNGTNIEMSSTVRRFGRGMASAGNGTTVNLTVTDPSPAYTEYLFNKFNVQLAGVIA